MFTWRTARDRSAAHHFTAPSSSLRCRWTLGTQLTTPGTGSADHSAPGPGDVYYEGDSLGHPGTAWDNLGQPETTRNNLGQLLTTIDTIQDNLGQPGTHSFAYLVEMFFQVSWTVERWQHLSFTYLVDMFFHLYLLQSPFFAGFSSSFTFALPWKVDWEVNWCKTIVPSTPKTALSEGSYQNN